MIEYQGKRGLVFRIKFLDATGRQVTETLGPERDGWTRRLAEAELRERLVRVDRKGYRRPAPLTFAEYAERWFTEGPEKRGWSDGTIGEYRSVRRRLEQHLAPLPLAGIRPSHVADLVAELRRPTKERPDGYAPATVTRDLGVLSAIFESALREELVETNPARRAERPKISRRRWRLLEPAEVVAVDRAFTELAEQEDGAERARIEGFRVVFLTLLVTGLRRHELQGLRWRHVDLIDNVLRVEKSKSEAGERSIAIPPRLAEELWQHRRRTAYQGDDELVFAHPERGTRLCASTYADTFRDALIRAGVDGYIRPFHDGRHASLTLGAATGEGSVALMTRAGHANMATTKQYLHLAGTVFRDEAERLETALLGGDLVPHGYPSELISHDPASPEAAREAGADPVD